MYCRACVALGVAAVVLMAHTVRAQDTAVRITYLYDNTVAVPGTSADWGFACLVQGRGRTILFDTGTKPDVLRANMTALKVDPAQVQAVVFSHQHGDHTLGIAALPAIAGLPVYVGEHFRLPPPAAEAIARMGAKQVLVSAGAPADLGQGFSVTNEMAEGGAYEQALAIDTPQGLVVIVGCAHPGIVSMLKQIAARTGRPIHMVIGGFHLLQTPAADIQRIIADLKALGVAWAGPSHCTGTEAMQLFRDAYGDRYVSGGVGTVVMAPAGSAAR